MANHFFYRSQFELSNSGKRSRLLPAISFGAAGAPTMVTGTGMGVASVTRNSTGDYTLALSKAAKSLLGLSCVINSGNAAPAAPSLNIRTNSVNSNSAPLIRIQFRDIAGALADPASGEIAYLEIKLNESSVSY